MEGAPRSYRPPDSEVLALNTEPTSTEHIPLPPAQARTVLRKLRDLDLRAETIALNGQLSIRIEGCSSTDVPIESSLRYRIRHPEGSGSLELLYTEGQLELDLRLPDCQRVTQLLLTLDADGRAVLEAHAACMDPATVDRDEVTRFLRAIVHAAFDTAA